MAETNKSQMLSEAEIIEAINQDSLISVSLGAGQPQKNVKMSTLASVAAELIKNSNLLNFSNSTQRTSADANTLGTGFYAVYAGDENASRLHYPAGYEFIFTAKGYNNTGFQIMFSASGGIYMRSIWDNWFSWKQI